MTHTPGPWTLRDDRLSPQVWVETVTGATRIVRFGARENWDAIDHGNANLLAAAPDLLDVCEVALEYLTDKAADQDFDPEGMEAELALLLVQLETEIAKAKGRPPKKES